MKEDIIDFLRESNYIEREMSVIALEDAMYAWKFAYANRRKIDLKYILEIHRRLMKRINPVIAGKLRTCNVWIGGHKKTFISEALLCEQIKNFTENLRTNGEKANFKMTTPAEEYTRNMHVAFEDIHPFEDGNGRTGRILWQIHRLNLGLPIKIIHQGTEQLSYYLWFNSNN